MAPSLTSMFRPGLRSPRANASCNWKQFQRINRWLCYHLDSTFKFNFNLPLHRSLSHWILRTCFPLRIRPFSIRKHFRQIGKKYIIQFGSKSDAVRGIRCFGGSHVRISIWCCLTTAHWGTSCQMSGDLKTFDWRTCSSRGGTRSDCVAFVKWVRPMTHSYAPTVASFNIFACLIQLTVNESFFLVEFAGTWIAGFGLQFSTEFRLWFLWSGMCQCISWSSHVFSRTISAGRYPVSVTRERQPQQYIRVELKPNYKWLLGSQWTR